MEIAATGLPGLSALASSTAGGEATAAFAAVLVAFGNEVSMSSDTEVVAAPSIPRESPLFAATEATFPEASPNSADMRLRLLASTAAVQTASAETFERETSLSQSIGEAHLSQPIPLGEGEMPGASPSAIGAQTSLLAPAVSLPELMTPTGEPQMLEEPMQEEGAAASLPAVSMEPGSEAVPRPLAGAPIEIPAETAEPIPQAGNAQETEGKLAADAPAVPPLRADDISRAQIAAPAQPIQAQASKPDAKKAQELTQSTARAIQSAATEADGKPAASSEGAERVEEPFAGIMQKAAPERAPLQPNAAPPPVLLTQTSGQQVAASAQPIVPIPSAPADAAPAPLLTSLAPQAPASPSETHPVMAFRSDKVAREMGVEIAKRVSAGGEELVIRLDPAELGRINIRMSVNEQGQLRAVVAADAPSVIEAIRSDLAELNRALEQAGVRTDSQSFRFDRGGSGDPGHQWQQRYQQHNPGTRHGDGSGLPGADDELSYRPLATNGRINMMA